MISVLINSEPNKGSSISTDYYHLGDLSLSLSGRHYKCLLFDETDIGLAPRTITYILIYIMQLASEAVLGVEEVEHPTSQLVDKLFSDKTFFS